MILAIRTDQPTAELHLLSDEGDGVLEVFSWQAHRELSQTLLTQIEGLLTRHHADKRRLTGIVVYQGPGSFTGLRIGVTVANTVAYGLGLPIAAAQGDDWVEVAVKQLIKNQRHDIIIPEYGSEANITAPRK